MAGVKIPHGLGFESPGSRRPARVSDAIQRELSLFFLSGVKDPRLVGLVVTGAEVTKDLRRATVYYACEDERAADVSKGLGSAHGFLRSHLASVLKMRYVPELFFKRDLSAQRIAEIERLLKEDGDRNESHS